jgi:helicase required for RNAi-mediated heterochromatin assembly 1
MCHPGEHPALNCSEKCDRLIDCGHKCTKLCKEKCLCTTIVNLGLSCGHSV